MQKNVSGQAVYFTLVSALSGNPVTGASGSISGRKSLDLLSGMIVLSGNVIELGGGSYRANLFDFDTNGNQVGYLFSASGCVPVQYQFDMIDGNGSGHIFLGSGSITSGLIASGIVFVASGPFVNVPIATISGVQPISGTTVTVPIASISGVQPISGTTVTVPIASISGNTSNSGLNVNADVIRWLTVAPNALLASGRVDAAFNTRTAVARSGTATTIQLDAGAPTAVSGIYEGDLITIIGGSGAGETRRIAFYDASGNVTVDRPWSVAAFNNSVFTITAAQNPQSGLVYPLSGAFATVPISSISGVQPISGTFVSVPITSISGVQPISGTFVSVPISSISGSVANSGLFVTVLPANLSGLVANSGIFVTVPIATISGVQPVSGATVTVPIASVSGLTANSGLNVNADVIRWRTVQPNNLTASGHVDASFAVRVGVARSGTATTIQLDAGAPTGTSGIYDGQLIYVVAGSGADEVRRIASYDSSGNVTVDRPFAVAPFNNTIFSILPAQNPQSGAVYPLSGAFVSVPISTLSGVQPVSGTFVSVPISSISGVQPISGTFVSVPKASISGVVANSGLFVTATATVDPAAISGLFVTVPPATLSGVIANSGLFVTATATVASGLSVIATVYSGQLSGQFVTPQSGTTFLASGLPALDSSGNVSVASGLFVTVPISSISGVRPVSGTFVSVPIASISGVQPVSGTFVSVPLASVSGVVPASGASVVATTYSGTTTLASGEVTYRIPYAVLGFDFTNFSGYVASGLSGRSVVNAERKLTNKWSLSAVSGYLRVYQEDDASVAYDQAVTTASGADPITSLDTK